MAVVVMSAEIAIADPCVVFALRRESMTFRRAYRYQQRFPGAPCRAEFRGPADQTVLMLETGLGAAAMESALRWCLTVPRFGSLPYRPRFVLLAGFSGAVRPQQRVGDVLLATAIVDRAGHCWRTHAPPALPSDVPVLRGKLLSVSHLVGDPAEKCHLGQEHDAVAVDMESATAAQLCQEYGVPFACLRVISDDLSMPLSPRLVELLRGGRVSLARLAWAVLRKPGLAREMGCLARQTRLAARRLLVLRSLLSPSDR